MVVIVVPVLDDDGGGDDFDRSSHGSLEPELPSHSKTGGGIDVASREFNETTST